MSDESKLPKWAIQRLDILRMEVKRLEDENKVLRKGWPKSNTALLSLGKAAYDELWLPECASVRFYLKGSETYGDKYYVDARVDRENGAQLTLMGYTSLRVVPQVSNVVHIEAAR
jgi:hypothetical protein